MIRDKRKSATVGIVAGIAMMFAGAASAEDVKLPKDISWTAYESGSSGYAQSVGIGNMLKKRYEVDLRIIPGKNDVSRMTPLRIGQSKVCACGIAAYFAQEGVLMFAEKTWGPQKLYNLFNNNGRNGQQAAVSVESGIKKPADLKGKRVTFVKGAPALNQNMEAFLAFGGLTWNDVVKVEVPGWGQSVDAVINGQADAVWGSTVSSKYAQLVASPQGLFLPPLPHDDKAGWERAHQIAPWWVPSSVQSVVPGYKGTVPYQGSNYPYPIFVSTNDAPDALAYGLTRAVMDNYADIKEAGPSMDGYQLSSQNFQFVFPYHPAAIKYYKEKGVWTAEHEAHNAKLLKRQDVLAAAWKEMKGKSVPDDKFAEEWLKVRAAALTKAGLPVVFK
ncbi:TAXI family TRAP transporter solute-binding subunit [Reyranella sp.]|uniref:TAXI family TRAP transporter solute-binding subunit n=1 Tax=Reyranella sp. TaxID=1929291 RepID=UPI003BAD02A7